MSGQVATAALPHLAFAARLALGIVFLLSALPKLRRPHAFARDVAAYEILPAGVARVFGLALIPVEAALALAFLTGVLVSIALPLAAAVLLAFLAAVGTNLRRGYRVSCGCFGAASEPISLRTLARLLLLFAVVLLLAAYRGAANVVPPALGVPRGGTPALLDLLPAAALAVFLLLLGTWLLHLPEIISLIRSPHWSRSLSGGATAGDHVEGA